MRTDKKKNISKVIKEVVKDPLQTEREIAEKTWVSKSSVNRLKQEMGQIGAKDDRILWICDDDLLITKLTQKKTIERLQDEEEKITMLELIRAWEVSSKRYSLLKWDVTDKNWWLKNIQSIEIL